MLRYVAVLALVAVTLAQDFDYEPRPAPPRLKPSYSGPSGGAKSPPPPPVAIIKQINKHNDDGSYTYGYETGDGSFKIETKLPNGEVKGKYGYVDDVGKVRVIEYGATKYGFAPMGEGITVPPPTIVDETTDRSGNLLPEYSGAYDQPDDEPAPSYSNSQSGGNFEFTSLPAARPAARPAPAPRPAPRPQQLEYSPPQTFEPAPEQARPAPPRPAPSSFSFDFPSRPAPLPSRPAFSPAPAPPRPSFANAAPLDDFGGIPTREAPKITSAQFAPLPQRPAPQPSFAPVPRPAAPQYRPAPVGGRPGGGSILDQLSKDYALPQGDSAPLHDISFGYY